MKKLLLGLSASAFAVLSISAYGQQRYAEEIFSESQVNIASDVVYGTNIDFLSSSLTGDITAEITELQTIATTGGEYPAAYLNPADPSTAVKLTNLKMDLYYPNPEADDVEERPLMIYVHTGNFLPPPVNGSPAGTRKDSLAVVACTQFAQRGFVAASVSYRLGWNPIATTELERRGTLLNAVYRAIQDVKQSVRFLRESYTEGNTYGIDPNKIVLVGEGSGGYVVLAYATVDNLETDLYIDKFVNPITGASYIDTTMVGNAEGFEGMLTLYRDNGQSTDINMTINIGGALGDISWLEPGDVPMVAIHAIRDDFAPFNEGTVIVPTTFEPVVAVHGSNIFIQQAVDYGNNDAFVNMPSDPYTDQARSLYGNTYEVSNGQQVTVSPNPEGLFPVLLPLRDFMTNIASPWQWWDPNSPVAQAEVQPGTTAHMAALNANPNMSPEQGRTYLDTIQGYAIPRVMCVLELEGANCTVGVDSKTVESSTSVYPNPTVGSLFIRNAEKIIRKVELFDITGRLVATYQVDGHEFELTRSNHSTGLYMVQIVFDDAKITRKVVMK